MIGRRPRTAAFALVALASVALPARGWADDSGATPAAWEKQLAAAEKAGARELSTLAAWCDKRELTASARRCLALALRLHPDDPKVRDKLGYTRSEDGTWDRPPQGVDALRASLADPDGPAVLKLRIREKGVREKAAERFRGLGRASDAMVARGADTEFWQGCARRAWDRVLDLVSQDEAALRALASPTFEGRPVAGFALPFLKHRRAREDAGKRLVAREFATSKTARGAFLDRAGLEGGSAKSEHYSLSSSYGTTAAQEMLQWAERARADVLEQYGVPEDVLPHYRTRHFILVRTAWELERIAEAAGWNRKKVAEHLEQFSSFYVNASSVAMRKETMRESIDVTIHYAARGFVHALRRYGESAGGKTSPKLEPWLLEALASDVSIRLTGMSLANFATMRRYAHERREFDGGNRWIQRARELVEMDLDVPLEGLPRKSLRLLGEPETLKAFAFFQFLFEKDPLEAQEFFVTAVIEGTEKAVRDVYDISFEALDRQYRRWISRTW